MARIRRWMEWLRDAAAKPPAEPRIAQETAAPPDPRELYLEAVRRLQAGEFEEAEATFLRYAASSASRPADGFAGAARAAWGLRSNRELDAADRGPSLPAECRDRATDYYRRALSADPDHVRSML